jgi:hypothetical protein
VSLEGRVVPGDSTPAATIDFTTMLPKAMGAYRERLQSRVELARTLRPPPKLHTDTLQKLAAHAAECADAEGSYGACEVELLSCAFGVQACDAARFQEKAARCDEARVRAEREHLQARLTLDSLSEEHRKAGIQAFAAPGCRAPWW